MEAVKKHPAKRVSARKYIVCSMLQEGKELNEAENKADQMLDRVKQIKSVQFQKVTRTVVN